MELHKLGTRFAFEHKILYVWTPIAGFPRIPSYQCVRMNVGRLAGVDVAKTWSDINCEHEMPFLCEDVPHCPLNTYFYANNRACYSFVSNEWILQNQSTWSHQMVYIFRRSCIKIGHMRNNIAHRWAAIFCQFIQENLTKSSNVNIPFYVELMSCVFSERTKCQLLDRFKRRAT